MLPARQVDPLLQRSTTVSRRNAISKDIAAPAAVPKETAHVKQQRERGRLQTDFEIPAREDVHDLKALFSFFADSNEDINESQRLISAKGLHKLLYSIGFDISAERVKVMLNSQLSKIRDAALPNIAPESKQAAGPMWFFNHKAPETGLSCTWDTNFIDFETFLIIFSATTKKLSSEQEIKEVFSLLDDDNDGFVDVAAFRQVVHAMCPDLSEEAVTNVVAEAWIRDKKHLNLAEWLADGSISYNDFVEFWMT